MNINITNKAGISEAIRSLQKHVIEAYGSLNYAPDPITTILWDSSIMLVLLEGANNPKKTEQEVRAECSNILKFANSVLKSFEKLEQFKTTVPDLDFKKQEWYRQATESLNVLKEAAFEFKVECEKTLGPIIPTPEQGSPGKVGSLRYFPS